MTKTKTVSTRLNQNERNLLKTAAELNGTNITDFIRRTALKAAEADIFAPELDRNQQI